MSWPLNDFQTLRAEVKALRCAVDAISKQIDASTASIIRAITEAKEEIIMDVKQDAATLQQGEAQIEQDIAGLGTAITKEISDFQAQVQADLQSAGVDPTVVEGVNAKFAALHTTISGLTSTVTAADPGAVAATPAPVPPAPTTGSTPAS